MSYRVAAEYGPRLALANAPLAGTTGRLHIHLQRRNKRSPRGMSTLPNCRIFFLPSFCLSSSLRLRVASPPNQLAVTSLRKARTVSRAMIPSSSALNAARFVTQNYTVMALHEMRHFQ